MNMKQTRQLKWLGGMIGACFSLGVAAAALAETAERPHAACKADREKFCKDVKPGEGRMRDCIMSHKDELSDGCKAAHKERMEKRMERRKKRRAEKAE